jgi:hypothetical protein
VGFKIINEKYQVVLIDIEKDSLTYYENITVIEVFQVGYDDFCFIQDQMVLPINQIIKNQKLPEPVAFQRLKNQLPSPLLAKYFPKYEQNPNNLTFFDFIFDNVVDCNPNPNYRPMPIELEFNETENGRRQMTRYEISWGLVRFIDRQFIDRPFYRQTVLSTPSLSTRPFYRHDV